MNDKSLTIKNVQTGGNTFYAAADWVELIWPVGKGCFVTFGETAGDSNGSIYDGTVYVMNSAGKTIDVLTLGQIAPQAVAA